MKLPEFLNDLMNEAQADAAVFLTFGNVGDDVLVTRAVTSGDAQDWARLAPFTPPDGFDHDDSDEALKMRDGQWCLRAPHQRHFNRFCWLDDDISQIAPWRRTQAFSNLHEPRGLTTQYRAMLVDQGMVSGWCALLWRSLRNRSVAEVAAEKSLGALRAIGAGITANPPARHKILLGADDELIGFDADALDRFSRSELEAISRRARRNGDETDRTRSCHGPWEVRHVPMSGTSGDAHLVLLEPMSPVTVDMRRALTSLQSEVARVVAEGATNSEASSELGVSQNTIKYHLKNIYELLGVSNRVELASYWLRS